MTKTVALDFDGCLHSYTSGWTGYTPEDGPEPGALAFVEALIAKGYKPVIVSSRADNFVGVRAIERWLSQHGFPAMPISHEKVAAVAYVDDRAVPYETGTGRWADVMDDVDRLAGLGARRKAAAESATTC